MHQKLPSWLCCQLGAREHYAIPRALNQVGQLAHLITDAWVPPHSALNYLPTSVLANLRERFSADLAQASVYSFTNSLIGFEIAQRIQKTSEWKRIVARNDWFQNYAVQTLSTLDSQLSTLSCPTLFAYSYAALNLFRYAKNRGWRTILSTLR